MNFFNNSIRKFKRNRHISVNGKADIDLILTAINSLFDIFYQYDLCCEEFYYSVALFFCPDREMRRQNLPTQGLHPTK